MKLLNCSTMIAIAAAGLVASQPAAAGTLSVSSNAVDVSGEMLGNLPVNAWKGPRSQQQQQQQQQQQKQQTEEPVLVLNGTAAGFNV